MNIAPDVTQKRYYTKYCRSCPGNRNRLAQSGTNRAVEVVNPAMQATIDAAMLTQMNRRGQIKDCIVDEYLL